MIYPISPGNKYLFWNGLDELGLLLGLTRLPGETNSDYRGRLEDVSAHPGNATYQGLVYALSREFGLTPQPALTITCPEGVTLPRISLENQELVLYTDAETIAGSWFLRDPAISTLLLLTQAINALETFQAVLDADIDPGSYPAGLLNNDSFQWMLKEEVPAATRFTLAHPLINPGTMVFAESQVFANYVDNPSQPGDFHVDPDTGEVQCLIMPGGAGWVTYQYRKTSLGLDYLPIIISDLNSPNSRQWFFSQVEQNIWDNPEQRFNPGAPSTFMQHIIDEINLNCPVLWGT